MNDPERPPLDPIALEQIRQLLHRVDSQHWPFIAEMRVAKFIPPSIPVPPQLPLQLLHILRTYASVLFKTEADQYQQFRDYRNYSPWLSLLADRIVVRVLNAVEKIDQGDPSALLGYHGVTRPEMEKALRDTLTGMVHHYSWKNPSQKVSTESVGDETTSAEAIIVNEKPSQQPKAPVHERKVFVESILEKNGWSILDWANKAEVSHATAMDYLQNKTKPYRSTRLKLATALDVSVDKLPK